jgi:hypothetical protein
MYKFLCEGAPSILRNIINESHFALFDVHGRVYGRGLVRRPTGRGKLPLSRCRLPLRVLPQCMHDFTTSRALSASAL